MLFSSSCTAFKKRAVVVIAFPGQPAVATDRDIATIVRRDGDETALTSAKEWAFRPRTV
jgi:hypothetical protein